MSWNEPGGDNKDPWSGRGDQKGSPDLDEAIRSLQEKISKLFGGKNDENGGGGGGSSGSNPFTSNNSLKNLGYVGALLLVLWFFTGCYIVNEGSQGIVTRFGQYTLTSGAGLNWHIPFPIEDVEKVNVQQQRYIEVGYRSGGGQAQGASANKSMTTKSEESLMLTKDENYVDVHLAVQYQIKDAKAFLFNLADPESTLRQVTESALRGVIGGSNMDFVLTEGRSEVVSQTKKEIQQMMDAYQSGIQIANVNLQDAQPPEQVQNAFADAIKAREDQQRFINEAEAYSNDVVPKARGAAARKIQEAQGYKEQVIAQAEGETSRFTQLLAEYKKAPEVTRKRLYLETMETVLSETSSVLVDSKAGNSMMYLPLDKLIQQRQSVAPVEDTNINISTSTMPSISERRPVKRVAPSPATNEDVQQQVIDRASSMRGRDRDGRGR